MDIRQLTNTGLVFISNIARMNPTPWGKCKKQAKAMVDTVAEQEKQRAAGQAIVDEDGNDITADTPLSYFVKTLVYWSLLILFVYLFTNIAKAISAAILSVVATLVVLTLLGRLTPSTPEPSL